MSRPVAALTGATGFLGGWLVRTLDDAGYDLRLLVRRESAVPVVRGRAPEVIVGALDQDEALERLVSGASVVIHAAGLIKARSRQAFFDTNATGVRGIAVALQRCESGAHFVLVSSIVARRPDLSDYAASKAAGEAEAKVLLPPEQMTVVRPPAVYGPGDLETLELFRAASRLPILPLPGPSNARIALIHAADAAAQIVAIAQTRPAGATYTLSDARPEGYRWREIMQAASRAVGRSPRLLPVPAAAVRAVGAIGVVVGRLGGRLPILTPGKARELLHPDWAITPQEQAEDLPSCRFDISTGFADTVAWGRAVGRL